jgi:ABC-type glutathione transport system ATPase component
MNLPDKDVAMVGIHNLSYAILKDGKLKRILKATSFCLETGNMCAILGPSGAGKR